MIVQRIDGNMILGIIPSHLVTTIVGIYPFLAIYPSSVTIKIGVDSLF